MMCGPKCQLELREQAGTGFGKSLFGFKTMEAMGNSSKSSSSRMMTMKARFQGPVEEMRSKQVKTTSINYFFVFVRIFVKKQWGEREGCGQKRQEGHRRFSVRCEQCDGQNVQVEGTQLMEREHVEIQKREERFAEAKSWGEW